MAEYSVYTQVLLALITYHVINFVLRVVLGTAFVLLTENKEKF